LKVVVDKEGSGQKNIEPKIDNSAPETSDEAESEITTD